MFEVKNLRRHVMKIRSRHFVLPSLVCIFLTTHLTLTANSQLAYTITASCSTTTVGRIPINDLGTGFYQGFQGGLYPNGRNQRPAVHDSAGRALATQVVPRNSSGGIDLVNGKIVLLSIGMVERNARVLRFQVNCRHNIIKESEACHCRWRTRRTNCCDHL